MTHATFNPIPPSTGADIGPEQAAAHVRAATALGRQHQFEAAAAEYEAARAWSPDDPDVISRLGNLYTWRLGRAGDAAALYTAAVRTPRGATRFDLYIDLAEAYLADASPQEVRARLEREFVGDAGADAAFHGLLAALVRDGVYDEAQRLAHEILDKDSRDAVALIVVATAITEQTHDLEAAEPYYWRALCADPGRVRTNLHWLGHLTRKGDIERARSHVRALLRNRARPRLSAGTAPDWDGSDPRGRTIAIDATIGFGDCIQVCRYATVLANAGAAVHIQCGTPLHSLVSTVAGVSQTFAEGADGPPADWSLNAMLAWLVVDVPLERIGGLIPYMTPAPQAAVRMRREIGQRAAPGLRVGLAWSSSEFHDRNVFKRRNIQFEELRPLLDIPGVTYFSLQHGPAARAAAGEALCDLGAQFSDFMDTAAAVCELDAVVTIDTSTAHVAGALGRETLTLLPYTASERWMFSRRDSPWYPTMTLFRQQQPGVWRDAIDAVRTRLSSLATRSVVENTRRGREQPNAASTGQ